MIDIIKDKQKKRFLYLENVYKSSKGSQNAVFDMTEVGEELGFSYDEISEIADYLIDENLIAPYGLGGTIHLTHVGIKEYEQAVNYPEKSTEHFLPINIIHINQMNNSSLQQGTHSSTINQQFGQSAIAELLTLIKAIEDLQHKLELSTELRQEWHCEVTTLKSQQQSPRPKPIIIQESLKTIRNLAEGIAGNALAPGVIAQITQFLSQF